MEGGPSGPPFFMPSFPAPFFDFQLPLADSRSEFQCLMKRLLAKLKTDGIEIAFQRA